MSTVATHRELHEGLAIVAALRHYRSVRAPKDSGVPLVSMHDAINLVAREHLPSSTEGDIKEMKSRMARYLGQRSANAAKSRREAVLWLHCEPNYSEDKEARNRIDLVDEVRSWILEKDPSAKDAFFVAVAIFGRQNGLLDGKERSMLNLQSWFGKGLNQKREAPRTRIEDAAAVLEDQAANLPRQTPRLLRQVGVKRRRPMDPRQGTFFG